MKANEHADIEVTWEDQKNINAFSKLNVKLEDEQERYSELKLELEYLEDLAMELELADEDDPINFKIADVFIELPLEEAQEKIQTEKERLEEEVEKIKSNLDQMEEQLAALKKVLYGKFKNAINLEKD
ncbi:hypothetical protein H4R33_002870 [Dimargaris cristalligena]|nr:hypothetical protein H4R33_002870 [Dimargaris cristalligena]